MSETGPPRPRGPHDPDELVSAVLDGEATDAEEALVRADAGLAARLEAFRSVHGAVAQPVPPPSEWGAERTVAAALAAADAGTTDAGTTDTGTTGTGTTGTGTAGAATVGPRRTAWGNPRTRRWLSAAAALLVVAAGALLLVRPDTTDEHARFTEVGGIDDPGRAPATGEMDRTITADDAPVEERTADAPGPPDADAAPPPADAPSPRLHAEATDHDAALEEHAEAVDLGHLGELETVWAQPAPAAAWLREQVSVASGEDRPSSVALTGTERSCAADGGLGAVLGRGDGTLGGDPVVVLVSGEGAIALEPAALGDGRCDVLGTADP